MSLAQLPPSCKFVAKVLEYEGTLNQSEITDKTDLSKRTVRYALGRLEEHGLVECERVMADARRKRYRLAETAR